MTAPDATPEDECMYTIVVHAVGLTDAEIEALFDRVADAAHDLNQQVGCYGGYDVESRIKAEALRETADTWRGGQTHRPVDAPADGIERWLRERADRIEAQS